MWEKERKERLNLFLSFPVFTIVYEKIYLDYLATQIIYTLLQSIVFSELLFFHDKIKNTVVFTSATLLQLMIIFYTHKYKACCCFISRRLLRFSVTINQGSKISTVDSRFPHQFNDSKSTL